MRPGYVGLEAVGERLAVDDGALSDPRDAVHPRAAPLEDAVPVNRYTRADQLVGHFDNDLPAEMAML